MTNTPEKWANKLFEALRDGASIDPVTDHWPGMTIDDAYEVSLALLKRREASGETIIGKKIGVTSEAVMSMLDVDQPDFGFLTDAMFAKDNVVDVSNMILPRAEAEIAFRLKKDLNGPGITETDVLNATESVIACFEIVDSRIKDWKIKIQDTVADNASCGVYVLGGLEVDPKDVDLLDCKAVVTKNGESLSQGVGAATLGSPLTAVAWLANTLGERGIPFKAGEVILSGSLVPLESVVAGDEMRVEIEGLGDCQVSFR